MRHFALLGLLATSVCVAQEQSPAPQSGPTQTETAPPANAERRTITLPPGTRISLTLTNPIHTKLARTGDAVRAVTAFPVAVNDDIAIPVGTYVDGTVEKIIKRGATGHSEVQTRFNRMLFPSGYIVSLDSSSTLARNVQPPNLPASPAPPGPSAGALSFQQPPPPLTPPPMPGPKYGTVLGVSLGVTAGVITALAIAAHHHKADFLFDSGSSFEMVLDSPLQLDAERASALPAGASQP